MQRASEGGCFLETVALGGAARWRRFDSATSWRSTFLMQKGQRAYPHPAACARCASSASHMSPVPPALGEDALRTVLNVGLHHSCRLHRGGCNPILFGGAAAQPVRRKRALLCALTRSPLHSSPFSAECHPLFSPHLFTPCSVRRLVGGAHAQTYTHTHTHTHTHASGIVASHCSPTDRAPVHAGATPRRFVFIFWLASFECLRRGNLPHARQSGDVPEHVHIRDGVGFTWEYAALTPSEPSPQRAHTLGLHRLPLKSREGKTHRITRMGFYGTLKMIFYKVSRVVFLCVFFSSCLCFPPPPVSPPTDILPISHDFMLDSLVSPSLSLTRLSRQIVRPLRRMNSSEAGPQGRRFNCPGPICCVVLCYAMC